MNPTSIAGGSLSSLHHLLLILGRGPSSRVPSELRALGARREGEQVGRLWEPDDLSYAERSELGRLQLGGIKTYLYPSVIRFVRSTTD